MKININGKEKEFNGDSSLNQIIHETCCNSNRVIAELNGAIIKQPLWEKISLKDGDTLELVNFVGGG